MSALADLLLEHVPDDVVRRVVFFSAVAGTWGYDGGAEWGVSHYRFSRIPDGD